MASSVQVDTKQAILKSKCSPMRVAEIMNFIKENEVLMRAVEKLGFKSLNHLLPVRMEFDLIKMLLDSFDVNTCSIFEFNIKVEDVSRVLGVPGEGKLIPSILDEAKMKEFKLKFKKRSLKVLASDLQNSKDLKEADISFVETFMLFILGNLFCPTTSEIPSVKIYGAISILPKTRDYNWAKFFLDFLLEGVKDYQRRTRVAQKTGRNIGVTGCIFFLQVFYLQKIFRLDIKSDMPIFAAWTQEEIRVAVKKKERCAEPPHRTGQEEIRVAVKKKERCAEPPHRMVDRWVPHDRMVDRLVNLEQAVFHIDPSVSRLNSTETDEERMRRLEDVVFGPRRNTDDDDSMEKAVKASFGPASFVHGDVIFLYLRRLRRTMSAGEALYFSLQNSYSYVKLESEFCRKEPRASLAEDLKYRENSYILFVVHKEMHYSLAVLYLPDEDESSSACVLHMDSFSLHMGDTIFQTIDWFFKQLWTNFKGENSKIPKVIKRTVKVPQQNNSHDCAFFVLHMIELFVKQAPPKFKMEHLEMISEVWFEPEEASARRKDIQPLVEEELKSSVTLSNTFCCHYYFVGVI